MDLYTVAEHELAQDIKQSASTLVSLALAGNDVGLYNMLDDLMNIASPPMNKKLKREFKNDEQQIHKERPNRQVVIKIADAISQNSKICLQIAQQILAAKTKGKNTVEAFKNIIRKIQASLGLVESIKDIKNILSEADDDSKKIAPPEQNTDKEEGDILYHLDVATRHVDVLVNFSLIHGHEDEIVAISTQIQELAQRLRTELEAKRVPYDERK
jgi:hypothetical protein